MADDPKANIEPVLDPDLEEEEDEASTAVRSRRQMRQLFR